ncbi:TIGR01244 family sulfur transferase [Celeribacter arenosi]|uniref:TIGR01244 family sulfur transferase n=1 Tax=Celeribacter arenosi TaxID=792649 RepID=A0ABP7KE35_9RHOB
MDFNKINDAITVSGQITPEDVATLAEKGFKTLVINRPDEEVDAALASDVMIDAAKNHGMAAIYLPIYPGGFSSETVDGMRQVLAEQTGPVYAYCRSGTRSCFAWGLSQAGQVDGGEILKQAAGAGYDLSPVAMHLSGE